MVIRRVIFACFTQYLPIFRFLAPSFLASLGAAGFVGYAFAQTKAVPSSSNVSFFHLLGVAGKDLLSFLSFTPTVLFRWIWD